MLALDISSTSIGYAVMTRGLVHDYGTIHLSHPIVYDRIAQAHAEICDLISTYQPRVVVVERNSGTHINGVIKCAWVVGGAILAAHLHGIAFVEVSAKAGKKLLAGNGNADKREMVAAAASRLGLAGGIIGKRKGSVVYMVNDTPVLSEHAADALGLLLAYQQQQEARLLEAA